MKCQKTKEYLRNFLEKKLERYRTLRLELQSYQFNITYLISFAATIKLYDIKTQTIKPVNNSFN